MLFSVVNNQGSVPYTQYGTDKQKAREVLDILKEFSKCSLHKAFFLYEALSLCSNQGQTREQK